MKKIYYKIFYQFCLSNLIGRCFITYISFISLIEKINSHIALIAPADTQFNLSRFRDKMGFNPSFYSLSVNGLKYNNTCTAFSICGISLVYIYTSITQVIQDELHTIFSIQPLLSFFKVSKDDVWGEYMMHKDFIK